MRLFAFALGILIGIAALGTRAEAQNYPWCAHYSGLGGTNCGFTTYDQCMATISGMGGSCMQNTMYQAPAPAVRPAAPAAATTGHPVQQKSHPNLAAPQPQ